MTEPTYEVQNTEELNIFLAGVLKDIRKRSITPEEADVMSKVADKINKNNIAAILEARRLNSDEPIKFFKINKELSI